MFVVSISIANIDIIIESRKKLGAFLFQMPGE